MCVFTLNNHDSKEIKIVNTHVIEDNTTVIQPPEECSIEVSTSIPIINTEIAETLGISRGSFERKNTCPYTDEELEMAKWIVQQEVMGGSLKYKIIITQILVNRLQNGYWGDTLKDVVLARGQFPSKVNWLKKINPPDRDTEKAVELVLVKGDCEDISQGALYFYNPKYVTNQKTINWFESLEFLFELEEHRFFR